MADDIDMDTGGVVRETAALTTCGETLRRGWADAEGLITGYESAIGDDPIGRAFRGIYDQSSVRTRETARAVPAALIDSAQVGHQCALLYRAADANGAATFRDGGRG